MLHAIGLCLASIVRLFRTRRSLWLENLALRQQFAVSKRKHTRPRLTAFDKLVCVLARKLSLPITPSHAKKDVGDSPFRSFPHCSQRAFDFQWSYW
jgi:hypothetical protein